MRGTATNSRFPANGQSHPMAIWGPGFFNPPPSPIQGASQCSLGTWSAASLLARRVAVKSPAACPCAPCESSRVGEPGKKTRAKVWRSGFPESFPLKPQETTKGTAPFTGVAPKSLDSPQFPPPPPLSDFAAPVFRFGGSLGAQVPGQGDGRALHHAWNSQGHEAKSGPHQPIQNRKPQMGGDFTQNGINQNGFDYHSHLAAVAWCLGDAPRPLYTEPMGPKGLALSE